MRTRFRSIEQRSGRQARKYPRRGCWQPPRRRVQTVLTGTIIHPKLNCGMAMSGAGNGVGYSVEIGEGSSGSDIDYNGITD